MYKLTRKKQKQKTQISKLVEFFFPHYLEINMFWASFGQFLDESGLGSVMPSHFFAPRMYICSWNETGLVWNFATALHKALKKCVPGRPICGQEELISICSMIKNYSPCIKTVFSLWNTDGDESVARNLGDREAFKAREANEAAPASEKS